VLFYRRKNAEKAASETALVRADASTVVIRELPLSIPESEVIRIFSEMGTIYNMNFRDLTEFHMLSVVDITYSEPSAAAAFKKQMNMIRFSDFTINVSIFKRQHRPDWKLSQRSQWLRLNTPDDFPRCHEFGRVINWNIVDETFYVMFESPEEVVKAMDNLGGFLLTNVEFVEKTGCNDLMIVSVPSVPSPLGKPQVMAVELDPAPPLIDADYIRSICTDCAGFDIFTVPSREEEGAQRILLYMDGRRLTKKVYTILCGHRFDGQLLRPRKLRPEDVLDPPDRKLHPAEKYGIYPLIAIDPCPEGFRSKVFEGIISELQEVDVWVENSAVIAGAQRLLCTSKSPRIRKLITQGLTASSFNGNPIKFSLVKANAVRDPLPV
jgi:hypothetical protein